MNRKLTRRQFPRISATAMAGLALANCSKAPVPEATEAPPTKEAVEPEAAESSAFNEAPMLAGLVASGDLPPIDKRLPFGTPGDIREEVRRRIEGLALSGASVFNQRHNIQVRVPPENITAIYEAA